MISNLTLPNWNVPAHERPVISDKAYLEWLTEERAFLIREGRLEKLLTDPARCPVNARFAL